MDRLLTPAEAMRYLGVSENTFRGLRDRLEHPIPKLRVGKSYRYDLDELRRWAEEEAARTVRD